MTVHLSASVPPMPPWRPSPPEHPWPTPQPPQPMPPPSPAPPSRVWTDRGDWPGRLYDRLLEQRIVLAHGRLDDDAATRLSAQLLTLDAEGTQPIRLELHGLEAELPAALSVMGVLDVVRAPVVAFAGGRTCGPALGVLAVADHRYAYPSALFVLTEPRMQFHGTLESVASQEDQLRAMLDELMSRLAGVTGRDVDEVRADFERQRLLGVDEAIDYGLIERRAKQRQPAGIQP